jgi:hypothetical protein
MNDEHPDDPFAPDADPYRDASGTDAHPGLTRRTVITLPIVGVVTSALGSCAHPSLPCTPKQDLPACTMRFCRHYRA